MTSDMKVEFSTCDIKLHIEYDLSLDINMEHSDIISDRSDIISEVSYILRGRHLILNWSHLK